MYDSKLRLRNMPGIDPLRTFFRLRQRGMEPFLHSILRLCRKTERKDLESSTLPEENLNRLGRRLANRRSAVDPIQPGVALSEERRGQAQEGSGDDNRSKQTDNNAQTKG